MRLGMKRELEAQVMLTVCICKWRDRSDLRFTSIAKLTKIDNELQILSRLEIENEQLNEKKAILNAELTNLVSNIETKQNELNQLLETYNKQFENINIVAKNQDEIQKITSELEIASITTVELDKKIYSWAEPIHIMITDPSANHDSNRIEIIGSDTSSSVEIISSGGISLSNYPLIETKSDSGIFFGLVQLTGFADYDVNNDGIDNDATGSFDHTGGHTLGTLPGFPNDSISVQYHRTPDETVVGSALVRWNLGDAFFGGFYTYDENTIDGSFLPQPDSYRHDETAQIIVGDLDLNIRSGERDTVVVKVFSDSDPNGMFLTLNETGPNYAYFTGLLQFSLDETRVSEGILKVSPGDKITLVYLDKTLPNPYKIGDELEITFSANILD